jgi:hypothetical protein
MGTKNIHVESSELILNGKPVTLKYTLASFAYLSEKYGDLGKIFDLASSAGKSTKQLMSREFLNAIADMIYAGAMKIDETLLEQGKSFKDADTSGLSPSKILIQMSLADIPVMSKQIQEAMNKAMPDADPTRAGESPAQ